jgi:peptidoglycan biosynthesis protein MviN/MurJ (putative lipid II flippase)
VALARGAFTAHDARTVATLVVVFAGSIVGLTLTIVATRGLFVLGRYRLVAILSFLSLGLYVLLAVILRGGYGREGLAVAFLVSALAGGAAAAALLVHQLDIPLVRFVTDAIVAPSLLACTFAAGAYAGAHLLSPDGSLLVSACRLVISASAGLLVFAGTILLLRKEDYRLAVRTLDRLRRP